MNPPVSYIRASARRSQRGFTLLLALGLIAMVTVGVLVALRAVSKESALQAHERRAREAFFAAEAGMAEARVVVQTLADTPEGNYNTAFRALGDAYNGQGFNGFVDETADGLPSDSTTPWFEVVRWTDYRMSRGTVGAGIDPSITVVNQELTGPDGEPITDYPEPLNVRYRVFLVDDVDGNASRTADENSKVWLVSVGEVATEGGQPYRTIIRSLITSKEGIGGGGGYGRKLGGSGNTGSYGGVMPNLN